MKKYASILLSSVVSIVAGCTMEETLLQEQQGNNSNGKEITIRATREDDPETRTVRDESDGSVWWVPGDAISLFYGSGTDGGSKFTSNATENSKITNFTGVITAITGGGEISVEETYFWGIYPYRDDVSCDGSAVTMTLPSQQTAVPGTFATDLFPSMGRSQGLIMGFYNVCGGWRFSVTKEGVRKVTLKSNNGEPITGKMKVGFDASGIPVVREIIDGSDEIVLESPDGEYFETGRNYYMILPPTVFSAGFTMTFETDTEVGIYNRTANTPIKRSKFSGITNIDDYLTTPYTPKAENIPIEDANFKAYLAENYDYDGDGEISTYEASGISELYVNGNDVSISSIQGIEYMPNLTSLTLKGTEVTNLNLSECKALTALLLEGCCLLSNLDLSGCTALTDLTLYLMPLSFCLDLSGHPALQTVYCYGCEMSSLDVSECTALTSLICDGCQLTDVEVSGCSSLNYLHCSDNQLTRLNLAGCSSLKWLECYDNQLTNLNVSYATALTDLHCFNNQLTSLDVSNNLALQHLIVNYNRLSGLDVTKNINLQELQCEHNYLSRLDISKNTDLTILNCVQVIDETSYQNVLKILYICDGQLNSVIEKNISEDTVIRIRPATTTGYEYVDLGLPSGVKWANFDIYDDSGSEYYAWGEVIGKGRYYWEHYYEWGASRLPQEGSNNDILKYNTKPDCGNVDNKTTLELEDDVAHDILGGNWRMPTYGEFNELIENCDWEQTSSTVFTATSKINGNSIQFYLKSGNYGMDSSSYEDGIARYWSSSLDVNNPTEAWRLTIRSNGQIEEGMEMVDMVSDIRSAGLAIRPVYDE